MAEYFSFILVNSFHFIKKERTYWTAHSSESCKNTFINSSTRNRLSIAQRLHLVIQHRKICADVIIQFSSLVRIVQLNLQSFVFNTARVHIWSCCATTDQRQWDRYQHV